MPKSGLQCGHQVSWQVLCEMNHDSDGGEYTYLYLFYVRHLLGDGMDDRLECHGHKRSIGTLLLEHSEAENS